MLAGWQTRNTELEQQLSMAIARITDLEKAVAAAKVGIPAGARRDEHDVFVSYRREQKEAVRKLVDRLRMDGLVVWWDADIPAQAPWEETIEKNISNSKVVVVCWSHEATKSESVKAEARYGRDRNKLIQVFLDDCQPPMFFGERQGFHFANWSGDVAHDCYRHLLEGIRIQL
ncbi:TIR domain-containing protein [Terricaulis silvestris]